MGMLDYLQENWRDIYRPFQRYPEIYGEHAKQGMGMLREDAPGAWDVATKPLGALMMSGIPSLYEAFRDEPIRNTLISDLGIDPQKADYATQAIGLGMDVGVPYAVIRKGLTPWISEQVAKQANPTGFSPSRRRFLKGAGATAVGTATGIPMLKQVAKTVPDFFADLSSNVSTTLKNVGSVADLNTQYGAKLEPTLRVLYDVLDRARVVETPGVWPAHSLPSDKLDNFEEVVEKAKSNLEVISTPDRPMTVETHGPWDADLYEYIDDIYPRLIDIEHASDFYKSNPKGFIASLEDIAEGYEGLVKHSKKPSGVPEHALKRDGTTEYFDPVMDQTVVYDPRQVKVYERSLKAAKDLLEKLR